MKISAKAVRWVVIVSMCLFALGCSDDKKDGGGATSLPAGQPASATSMPVAAASGDQQALQAIESAKSAGEVKPFLTYENVDVVKAAMAKLGRIGDEQAVTALKEALASQKREAGTGDEGQAAAAITALGATNRPEARQVVMLTLDTYLKDGPLVQGPYSHIADTQYYNTLLAAIAAASQFDDPQIDAKFQAVADDSSRFYIVRQAAQEALLNRQVRQQNLDKPADRVAMLLTKADFAGSLAENTWSGKAPGDKTPAAIKQAAVEKLLMDEGWDAAGPVSQRLSAAGNDTERLALAKLLSAILMERLAKPDAKANVTTEKQMLVTLIDELAKLGPAAMASPTLERTSGRIQAAAEALEDADIYAKAKALHDRIKSPDAWAGPAPDKNSLGVALPPDAKFMPEPSRKIVTPYGTITKAYFVSNQPPQELVKYFQGEAGQKGAFTPAPSQAPAAASQPAASLEGEHFIPIGQAPTEITEWVKLGVTVYVSQQPFEYSAFGKVVYSGRTLFAIIAKQ